MIDLTNARVIGIDCAADPENIAIASATKAGTRLTINRVFLGSSTDGTRPDRLRHLATAISGLVSTQMPTLLALDAPLGWPVAMRRVLAAGAVGPVPDIPEDTNLFFRRSTDRFVARTTGRTPQSVGASLVTHLMPTALRLIGLIAEKCGGRTSMGRTALTQDNSFSENVHFIEVYPALAGPLFLGSQSQRPASWREADKKLKETKEGKWEDTEKQLRKHLRINFVLDDDVDTDSKRFRDHGLDAILCAWIGFRFLQGECVSPPSTGTKINAGDRAREGWIWFDRDTPRLGKPRKSPKA